MMGLLLGSRDKQYVSLRLHTVSPSSIKTCTEQLYTSLITNILTHSITNKWNNRIYQSLYSIDFQCMLNLKHYLGF